MKLDLTIKKECGDLLFDHHIGSVLIDNRSPRSDYDILKIYKTNASIDFFFLENYLNTSENFFTEVPAFEKKVINGTDSLEDVLSIDFLTLLSYLIDGKKNNILMLNKLASHLYALKHGLITNIKDTDAHNFYLNWLKSPGISTLFWYKYRQVLWLAVSSLPDKDLNWSQKYNNSSEHQKAKDNWFSLRVFEYPVVDKELGYDPYHTKKIIQNLMVSIAVLTRDDPLSSDDKDILNKIKNCQINYNEYLLLKREVWKKFRIASESLNTSYFLGSGDTLEESKNKKTYGLNGLKTLVRLTSNIESDLWNET